MRYFVGEEHYDHLLESHGSELYYFFGIFKFDRFLQDYAPEDFHSWQGANMAIYLLIVHGEPNPHALVMCCIILF